MVVAQNSCCYVSLIWKNIYNYLNSIKSDNNTNGWSFSFPLSWVPPPLISMFCQSDLFPLFYTFPHFVYHAFVRAYLYFSSLTRLQKLAPWLIRVLIPFVIIAGNTTECAGPTSESYVTATTTAATIYTRQSICIAQRLLGEGLVSPIALEATFRFPLVLVTPVKFSFTCCKKTSK